MKPLEAIGPALAGCLDDLAQERDCGPDDLSVFTYRALEKLALEAFRLGTLAWEEADTRPLFVDPDTPVRGDSYPPNRGRKPSR